MAAAGQVPGLRQERAFRRCRGPVDGAMRPGEQMRVVRARQGPVPRCLRPVQRTLPRHHQGPERHGRCLSFLRPRLRHRENSRLVSPGAFQAFAWRPGNRDRGVRYRPCGRNPDGTVRGTRPHHRCRRRHRRTQGQFRRASRRAVVGAARNDDRGRRRNLVGRRLHRRYRPSPARHQGGRDPFLRELSRKGHGASHGQGHHPRLGAG